MADRLTRRRFITDVLYVAGGLLAASLVAAGVHGSHEPVATPTPIVETPTPECALPGDSVAPTPRYEAAGKVAAPPPMPGQMVVPSNGVRHK